MYLMYLCTDTHSHTNTHTQTHTQTHTNAKKHTHVFTHDYMHTQPPTHPHMHSHTHNFTNNHDLGWHLLELAVKIEHDLLVVSVDFEHHGYGVGRFAPENLPPIHHPVSQPER